MALGTQRSVGRLALVIAVVGLISWACLVSFFIVGGPLGKINDTGNGVLALLTGVLAVKLRGLGAGADASLGRLATLVACIGATVAIIGSVLIITDTTGFFLAGLFSSAGFGLIGVWLVWLNRWIVSPAAIGWPTGRVRLGVIAGAVMISGLLSLPGLVMGIDNMETAPLWAHMGGVSWLGTYILFPLWTISWGRALAGRAVRLPHG